MGVWDRFRGAGRGRSAVERVGWLLVVPGAELCASPLARLLKLPGTAAAGRGSTPPPAYWVKGLLSLAPWQASMYSQVLYNPLLHHHQDCLMPSASQAFLF